MGNVESLRGQIAERIKKARKDKHLTQPELSEFLAEEGIFIAPSAIAKIENNKRGLEIAEAAAIAKILGLKLEQLIRTSDESDDFEGIELQEQAFASGLYAVRDFADVIESVTNHIEIVALKVKLKNSDHKVSLYEMQTAYEKAEEVVELINEASNLWRRVLVYGRTLSEGILEDDLPGYGGSWELPPLEDLLGIDNGEG